MTSTAWIEPPASVPWYLRPLLWVAARITGKDPLPGRLLAHFPRGALGAGAFEALAASDKDLEARVLAVARIVASAIAGCPFCTDMNAATWRKAGLTASDLALLLELEEARWPTLGPREAAAARYAAALSKTPVLVAAPLQDELRSQFTPRELVVLATTIAQVNYWSRFNQGLGVPSSGFFADDACALPPAAMARINGDS